MYFFFNDTATTEIYTLSLHDALPIYRHSSSGRRFRASSRLCEPSDPRPRRPDDRDQPVQRRRCSCARDRKSTRLNSSHANISYAVFCLKIKKKLILHHLLHLLLIILL